MNKNKENFEGLDFLSALPAILGVPKCNANNNSDIMFHNLLIFQ
jgi:hypothetical protein